MKKILILSNHHTYTYNFRKEIIQELLDNNYKVYIVLPYGKKVDKLIEMGCEFIQINLDRRGMNPRKDLRLLRDYYKIIKTVKPHAVLSYTIKPSVYGGLVTRLLNIPFFPNVTGLGSAVEKESIFQKFMLMLHRLSFKNAACVFFQNKTNLKYFWKHKIIKKNHQLIPGSGVNLKEFSLLDYPSDEIVKFVFISRIMREKGIDQYLEAAKNIKAKYPNTEFHVCGFCEQDYEKVLHDYEDKGIIIYHGMVNNIVDVLKEIHCTVHPTYYPEGMSNVLLESAASGRPVLTTNRSGCREIVDNARNGYLLKILNSENLSKEIERFILISYEDKKRMGLEGRFKVENEYDRKLVVDSYIKNLKNVI